MDLKQFLAEFGHITRAQGGIQRLREMILSLAVTGKLVKSNLNEPGIASLSRIADELSQYQAEFGRETSVKTIKKATLNFDKEYPSHWPLVQFQQIGVLIRGVSYKKSAAVYESRKGYIGLLRSHNISSDINFNDLIWGSFNRNLSYGSNILWAFFL